MAIARPATKTKISTTEWGWPITDEVNRMTPLVVAPEAWVQPTLSNGWVHDSANPVQYRRWGNEVHVRGRCKSGSGGFLTFFYFPVGFRPAKETHVACAYVVTSSYWATTPCFIYADGNFAQGGATNASDYSFCFSFWLT